MRDGIVDGTTSGGTNTSHTIILPGLRVLLDHVPPSGGLEDYERAVVDDNVLGKATEGARRRTFRYLRELYVLRPDSLLFRALRDLWPDDPLTQPLLAGLCALARDAVFRGSAEAIFHARPGEAMTSRDLAEAVEKQFPGRYSQSTLAKIGRNTLSSWEQSGHLEATGTAGKRRVRAVCKPAAVAYALMLGHLQGFRGQALFETVWARVLDQPRSFLEDQAVGASQRGLLEFRSAGGVVEVGFRQLLRPIDDQQGALL